MFTCLLQGPETRNQAIYKHTRMAGSQTFFLTSITLYVRVMTENYKNIQYVEHIPVPQEKNHQPNQYQPAERYNEFVKS